MRGGESGNGGPRTTVTQRSWKGLYHRHQSPCARNLDLCVEISDVRQGTVDSPTPVPSLERHGKVHGLSPTCVHIPGWTSQVSCSRGRRSHYIASHPRPRLAGPRVGSGPWSFKDLEPNRRSRVSKK